MGMGLVEAMSFAFPTDLVRAEAPMSALRGQDEQGDRFLIVT